MAGFAAYGDPVIIVSDGVTSTGPIALTNNGSGAFATSSFDSSWSVVVTAGESKPLIGTSNSPNLELDIQATSLGSANPLTVILSDNNFGPTSGNNNLTAQFNGQAFGGAGSPVTFNTYIDTNNALAALTTILTTSGAMAPNNYLNTETGSLSLAGPYSLSEVVTIPGTTAAAYSLLANLQASNQPCTCTVSFTCPSNQVICESDTPPDPNAEAARIIATDSCLGTVPVTFIGAVTNGTCPSPTSITYIFGAHSSCGQLFTCNQTITVSCLPACNVTTVSSTIAGTSNLTASVQNAGTGASYSWSIMNGTITAGQGTSSITYTAGADTNNPVHVCVSVTSAAGCESTCCASVPVSPKPPTITLTQGDTATIGFWHNKNGQAVINSASNSPALGNWLGSTFPCMLGSLSGKSNSQVASAFLTDFGNVGGLQGNDTAQFFAAALACYFTSTTLDGTNPSPVKFGFNQSPGGTGSHTFNVGSNGAAFGVPNNTSLTVLQILQYIDQNECPLSGDTTTILGDINNVLNGINQGGDIQ
ncbi:MAG TPA: hypothetical protein VKV04_06785 [Verrucomicrobiae bacterium]|nr:hypothetical protein [Verrucomicrobiae bacterium]